MQNTVAVTDEDLKKALDTLGITTDVSEDLEKGKKPEDKVEEKEKPSDEPDKDEDDDEVEKSYNKTKAELEEIEKSCGMKKAELEGLEAKRKNKTTQSPVIQKSEEDNLLKAQLNGLMETQANELGAIKTLLQSLTNQNDLLKSENSDIKKSLSDVTEQLNQIGNQSQGRKSFTSVKAIEKSFGNGEAVSGKKLLSISENKQEVNSILYDLSGIEKGEINNLYSNATMDFEASGVIGAAVVTDLFNKHNIQLVK